MVGSRLLPLLGGAVCASALLIYLLSGYFCLPIGLAAGTGFVVSNCHVARVRITHNRSTRSHDDQSICLA